MTMVTRKRPLPFGGGNSSGTTFQRKTKGSQWEVLFHSTTSNPRYMGTQITASENHGGPPSRGADGDVGGPFSSTRQRGKIPWQVFYQDRMFDYNYGKYKERRVRHRLALSCPIELQSGQPKWPTMQKSSESSLNALGATAISRCKPTASSAELSVALGEGLREGVPAIPTIQTWRDRTLKARNAGSEYLNIQFGWAPLVSEVTNFGNAVANHRDILDQYDADRGKLIRRRYEFPVESSSSDEYLGLAAPVGASANQGIPGTTSQPGKWTKNTTTIKRRWFSGAFRYGVPQGSDPFSRARAFGAEADRLFGLSLTPDVLWNLAPWSWAVDWVTNTGDVLSNVGDVASQGLVMQYGYMMEHTITKVTYSLTGATICGEAVQVPDAVLTVESKQRIRANPFGFGITWDGLSSFQASILAALGISRK